METVNQLILAKSVNIIRPKSSSEQTKQSTQFIRNYYGISDLGLTLPHFEFLRLYLDMSDQN